MPQYPCDLPRPSMGRMVIFVDECGSTYPAVVRQAYTEDVSLTAFTALGTREITQVPYAPEEGRERTTWHWAPRG